MAKKILIVDDELSLTQALSVRLKASNYEVIAAVDAIQALNKAHQEKPDLILLDIKMPAGDGVTVYEKLKKSSETGLIPVIFITAYASEETKQKVLEMGAEDFISKPFNTEELLTKVKKALGGKGGNNG